jgi:YidC/Oxa1 family membrane protein insertase
MTGLPVPGFETGGMAWFTDLTVADPYYILPVASSMGILALFEIGSRMGVQNAQAEGMKNVFRVLAIVTVPLLARLPAVSCIP